MRARVYPELDGIKRQVIGKLGITGGPAIKETLHRANESIPKDLEYFAFRIRASRMPTRETIEVPYYYAS